jgi:hypothetical protein
LLRAYADLEKANKAAYQSSYDIRRLQKELELVPTGSEAGSITGATFPEKLTLGRLQAWLQAEEEKVGAEHPLG